MSNIGVVFGGASSEHEVSIRSAITVIGALRRGKNLDRFKVTPIYIDKCGKWWPAQLAEEVIIEGKAPSSNELPKQPSNKGFSSLPAGSELIDVWYPVLHGPNGEDGTVQGLFKLIGKPFVGSGVLGSALGMDKIAMKAAFSAAGLPQVPYEKVDQKDLLDEKARNFLLNRLESELGYPCFVKPANLGSSIGITKAHNRSELLQGISEATNFDNRLVVEKGIKAREFECAVLGRNDLKTSLVGEVCFNSDWYSYDIKYSENSSEMIIPAALPKQIESQIRSTAVQACQAIDAYGMARVDFFYDSDTNDIWLNEINTLPGFTSQSMYPKLWEASGVTLEQLVSQLVDIARE